MRSITEQKQLEQKAMAHLGSHASPQTCCDVARALNVSAFDARALLIALVEAGHVLEYRFEDHSGRAEKVVYELAHGGYAPGPEAA